MGIVVEPVIPPYEPPQEPCVDSDCYYAQGERLDWWDTSPPPSSLPSSPIEEPIVPRPTPPDEPGAGGERDIPEYPGTLPTPPPSPSPTPSPAPSPGNGEHAPSPPPSDPLYAAISGLLSQRPPVQPRETPVVLVPQGTTSPVLPLLLVVLGVGGVVAYVYLRRK